ncbi:hypothetical protein DX873_15710 [Flagellimonas nanhaiensis]|uniref:Uncharacterized protein n=1 Tax=Flagellimonas nanhaiensis TaxID=2292706 RepID=A0A371JMT3_9FLAO|nr:hypothetical protein DX873_15710 [Allomuricauda nanhaiensis]
MSWPLGHFPTKWNKGWSYYLDRKFHRKQEANGFLFLFMPKTALLSIFLLICIMPCAGLTAYFYKNLFFILCWCI